MKKPKLGFPVHLIPLGLERDRTMYLLDLHPPGRIHFLDPFEIDEGYKNDAKLIQEQVAEGYPRAKKIFHTVCCYDFNRLLVHLFEIVAKEKALGNSIVPHIFSGSTIYAVGLYLVSCLTRQNVEYVRAKDYHPVGTKMITAGVDETTYTQLHYFPIAFPDSDCCDFLDFLLSKEEDKRKEEQDYCWKGTRLKLVTEFEPYWRKRKLAHGSKGTAVSNIVSKLKQGTLLRPRTRYGKVYTLTLTASGKLMGKIARIRKDIEKRKNLEKCTSCEEEQVCI